MYSWYVRSYPQLELYLSPRNKITMLHYIASVQTSRFSTATPISLLQAMASKRTITTRISSTTSQYNSSVTLLHLSDSEDSAMPRKRVKVDAAAPKTSPKKRKPVQQELATPHPAPERWQETYDAIKEMRSKIVAPVDTMGCDTAQRKETDPKVRP